MTQIKFNRKKTLFAWLPLICFAALVAAAPPPVAQAASEMPLPKSFPRTYAAPESEPAAPAEKSTSPPSEAAPKDDIFEVLPVWAMGFSLNEFVVNYNKFAGTFKTRPLDLASAERSNGSKHSSTKFHPYGKSSPRTHCATGLPASARNYDIFQVYIFIQCPADSDRVIRAVFSGNDDHGTRSTTVDAAALNFVAALTPNLDDKSRSEVINQLGLPGKARDGQSRQWQDETIKITSRLVKNNTLLLDAGPVK